MAGGGELAERINLKIGSRVLAAIAPVIRVANSVGVGLVVVMVLLVVLDVCLRYFFHNSILGTVELEELMLCVVIFLGIAYTGLQGGHVGIDILHRRFTKGAQAAIDSLTSLLGMVVVALIAWQSVVRAIFSLSINEHGGVTGWPYWPFMLVMGFGCSLLFLVLLGNLLSSLADVKRISRWPGLWLSVIGIVAVALTLSPAWVKELAIRIPDFNAGLIGIGVMLILMALKMPIAFAMAFVGFIGMWYVQGIDAILPIMAVGPWIVVTQFVFCVLPFFVLMGMFAFYGGISRDLYDTAYKWVGHQPGGLSMASIAGCAGFAAICGCSTATAASMGTIALPEMKRYNYNDSLATGSVAAGGTLGILIPPSMGFIIYAILTEESVGELFIAGIFPGILLAGTYMLSSYIRCRFNPRLGPRGEAISFKEKVLSLKGTGAMLFLFLLVMGGIYLGVFSPTEAGAIGAFGALVISLASRRLSRNTFVDSLLETGKLIAMIFAILCGVKILGYFIAVSKIPMELSDFIVSLGASPYVVLVLILFVYVILGMLMNIMPMIMLTLPILYPTILGLGFDPIWFGVIMVIMMEMGQITPPVGINVYVISGIAKDVPMGTIFKGIIPFWGCQVLIIIILVFFPQIATFLPAMMR